MSFTARPLSTNALYQAVNQAAHGFSVGEVIAFNGATFINASAATEADANQTVGVVSNVPDANSFFVTQEGFISGLTTSPTNPGGAYVPGTLYYLSPTVPGSLTATKPSGVGNVIFPIYLAYTADSGFVMSGGATVIGSGNLFSWTTVAGDTSMLVNNGYFVNAVAPTIMTLPAVAAVGDVVEVYSICTEQITIAQNALQTVIYLDEFTTVGPGGSVEMLQTNGSYVGSIRLVCLAANTDWAVLYGSGNWQYN